MTTEEKAAADKKAAEQKAAEEKAAADKKAGVLVSEEDAKLIEAIKAEEAKGKKAEKAVKEKADNSTDYNDYQRFAELHFLQWDGRGYERKRLKPATLKLYDKLEAKFKDKKGKKPKKSATAFLGIGKGNGRLVEGYAVPNELYEAIKKIGAEKRYF